MRKKLFCIGSLIILAFELMADFPTDFQEAKKLFDTRKNTDAQEVFQKLATTAPTPKSKAECLSYAAKALGRDKMQYDAAMESAKKIEIREISIITQLDIMQENRKFKELFDSFKDEDFSKWPEICQLQAYTIRGCTERIIGQYDAAKKDLIKAIEISGSDLRSKIIAQGALNDVYFQTKDYENIIKNSKQIFELKQFSGFFPYLTAVLLCAQAQVFQGKLNDALETMKLIDHMKTGVYKCQALIVYGDIYARQGKKDEASAKYKEAIAMKGQNGIADFFINQAQKKLEAVDKK